MRSSPIPQPRICIIGAGPSGLAMAKNLLQAGLRNFVVFDRQRQPGGNWVASDPSHHSSVYEHVRSISSRTLTQMSDLPFPPGTPDYPSRRDLLAYLRSYTHAFGLQPFIRTNSEVVSAARRSPHTWQVTLADGQTFPCDALIIANGHHSTPNIPSFASSFTGEFLHSHDFKTSAPFGGKRVLIVGGGNSAADIAVDIARRCGHATMSLRRGYYILPRHILGLPSDVLLRWFHFLPPRLLQAAAAVLMRISRRPLLPRGMPTPDHNLFATHPLINSELAGAIERQTVTLRGPIAKINGKTVTFTNGDSIETDVIIACTGFLPSFPFLEVPAAELPPDQPLYLRMVHISQPKLFFLGLFQPSGSIWPLADLQARLLANHLAGRIQWPADLSAQAQREQHDNAARYIASPRHRIEVDFYRYRRQLLRVIPSDAPAWPMTELASPSWHVS